MTTFADDNPYEVLEIEPDAEEAVIKAAYRRLARKWHPDHCKDPQAEMQFCRVQNAYDLLMNAETRAHYDRTGVKGDAPVDPGAHGTLISLCLQWAQLAEYYQDFRIFARQSLKQQVVQVESEICMGEQLITKVGKKIGRLTRKSEGTNFLVIAMENRVAELKDNMRQALRLQRTLKRALELVEDFDYDARPEVVHKPYLNYHQTFLVTPSE